MRRLVEVRQRFLRRWSRRKLASHRLRYTALLLLALSALLVLATILCFIQWVMLVLDVTDGWAALVLCITLIIDFIALSGVMLLHPVLRGVVPRIQKNAHLRRMSAPASVTIFVAGVASSTVPITLNLNWKISDVLRELRRRHLMPKTKRLRTSVYFDTFRRSPLDHNFTLAAIGIQSMSTLSVRYALPGGSLRTTTPTFAPSSEDLEELLTLDKVPSARNRGRGRTSRRRAEDTELEDLLAEQGFDYDGQPLCTMAPPIREVVQGHTGFDQASPSQSAVNQLPVASPTPSEAISPIDASASSLPNHDFTVANATEDLDFLELYLNSRLRAYSYSGPLVFIKDVRDPQIYTAIDIDDNIDHNAGIHALDPKETCNEGFLEQEEWLLLMFREVTAIASMDIPALHGKCEETCALLRQEWARMQIHKEGEWSRQRHHRVQVDSSNAGYVDTSRHFIYPPFLSDPTLIVHHITALLMYLIYRVPRRATRILLVGLRSLVRISEIRFGAPKDRTCADSLPVDIRTILGRLDLDPVVHSYVCCPVCFALYAARPYPSTCSNREAPNSEPCGASLWRSRTIRGKTLSFPIRVYLHQDVNEWLGRLVVRPGMEDLMDAPLEQASGACPPVMSDVWDAPVFRDLKKDGIPFIDAPPGEGRLIFGLSIDGFNPFQSKQAKQQVTVTAIYLYLFNIPPRLRYLPENMCLVGVIPGPHKPSLDQLNHFLKPLVDQLLVLWHTGVFFSRTAKYAMGRLVRCALVPLVCDLPAARQAAGFGHYSAKFFCSMCRLLKVDINNLDPSTWPPYSGAEHRAAAEAWKDKPSASLRKAAFEENSVRWSALLDLPYWDPVRYTVIDSMHNHYLGLLKHHCRRIWGMNIAAEDATEDSTEGQGVPEPSDEEISTAFDRLYSGTEAQLMSCKRAVLIHLCSAIGIQRGKSTKAHLVQLLLEWRQREGIEVAQPGLSNAQSSANVEDTPPSPSHITTRARAEEPRTSGRRRDAAAAEVALLSGNSLATLKSKFNADVFVTLCERYQLSASGRKEELVNRLIQWRESTPNVSIQALPRGLARFEQREQVQPNSRVQRPPPEPLPSPQTDHTGGTVLGRTMLGRIHAELPFTELPSWVDRVPTNVGTKARGKLSADQWHILCVINLPIILIRIWGRQGGRPKQMLDNFMDLVTEVVIGGMLEMSEEAIKVYEEAALRYLRTARELYNINITPNQHNSLHIPFFLRLFGPLHSIRTFFSERMNYLLQRNNTNMRFGELEVTYMKHTCRAANLRTLLGNEQIRENVHELVDAFDAAKSEDRRGTRMRESTLLGVGPRNPDRRPPKQIVLDDLCFKTLVDFLNAQVGQERFVDMRISRRTPGLQQLSNRAFYRRSTASRGVSFLSASDSPKDSNIIYQTSTSSGQAAGRIEKIFSYRVRDDRGDWSESVYLLVSPLQELSSEDGQRDPYRRYPYVGGRLYYATYLPSVIITEDDIISHFARTLVDLSPDIQAACVHVLPLDKSVRLLKHHPSGEVNERDMDLPAESESGEQWGADEHEPLGFL